MLDTATWMPSLTTPSQAHPSSVRIGTARRGTEIASGNSKHESLIGMDYHNTLIPNVILRNVLESLAWYTSYTSHQPEIAQGRLKSLLNYQTTIISLSPHRSRRCKRVSRHSRCRSHGPLTSIVDWSGLVKDVRSFGGLVVASAPENIQVQHPCQRHLVA
ncbi:hypothetical protein CF326_g9047 [Tilletia indica]|nr:hypothetical protein CF326_g9047 [Tilletia indica]